ncbi:SAM-dependent methyltransferase [Candidatus Woesearchaeota archaeon CG1_02_47_18]|nr:MAG: SAM-dependent methyltransferase [Candidatus Woesearchaeota archaeon CG1_02_47_18]
MGENIPKRVWKIMRCPLCGGLLSRTADIAKCTGCSDEYNFSDKGQLDLRLRRKKQYQLQFELGAELLPNGFDFKTLQKNPTPEVDFTGLKTPWHLTEELMSYFPKARSNESIMLDIGCGSTVHREICEHAGFSYVGFDYNSSETPILGDAHALPFKDNSFEFILSIAVLEHIQNPFIMMKEAYRVLKPDGRFIGSVAFLEPFHGNSFYHHSHLGIFNSLKFAGFEIQRISPSPGWNALIAEASMCLFPGLPHRLSEFLIQPLNLFHRFWWRLAYAITHAYNVSESYRLLSNSGAFYFIATKKEKNTPLKNTS